MNKYISTIVGCILLAIIVHPYDLSILQMAALGGMWGLLCSMIEDRR